MSDPAEPAPPLRGVGAGLCDSCVHQQIVRNTRGSSFSLCRRSRHEEAYPRYPRVPVLACPGHTPVAALREPRGQADP